MLLKKKKVKSGIWFVKVASGLYSMLVTAVAQNYSGVSVTGEQHIIDRRPCSIALFSLLPDRANMVHVLPHDSDFSAVIGHVSSTSEKM